MTAYPDPVPSLRDWALAVYARPGVEEACLRLQDRHGMDVGALLWCAWAGEHRGAIDAEAMGRIVADVGAWQAAVVTPLRTVRRNLKQAATSDPQPGADAPLTHDSDREARDRLRRQVADAELAAEVIHLDRLESSVVGPSVVGPSGAAAVRANIASLVSLGGHGPDRDRDAAIEALLAGIGGAGS